MDRIGDSALAQVNQETGEAVTFGLSTNKYLTSLEISSDGRAYARSHFSPSYLYEVDLNSGAITQVGGFVRSGIMDLAFDSNDVLYATGGNFISLVNTSNGHHSDFTYINGMFHEGNPVQISAIMFDNEDNLYATAWAKNSPLWQIDLNAGTATVIGSTGLDWPVSGDFGPCDTKACILSEFGVPGHGIDRSPGLQASFNDKLAEDAAFSR